MNDIEKKIIEKFFEEADRLSIFVSAFQSATISQILEKNLDEYATEMCRQQRELCAQQVAGFSFHSKDGALSEGANKVFASLHEAMINACKNAPSPMITNTPLPEATEDKTKNNENNTNRG